MSLLISYEPFNPAIMTRHVRLSILEDKTVYKQKLSSKWKISFTPLTDSRESARRSDEGVVLNLCYKGELWLGTASNRGIFRQVRLPSP